MKSFLLKNIILLFTFLYFFISGIEAQCPGLKNPTSFANFKGKIGGIKGIDNNTMDPIQGEVVWKQEIPGVSLDNQYTSPGVGVYGGIENILQRGMPGAEFTYRFEIVSPQWDSNTCGNLWTAPPDPSFNSVIRIGNSMNSEVEELYYEMTVNANNSLLIFWYALVMEDPGHGEKLNPKVEIEVQKYIGLDNNGKEIWQNTSSCTKYYIAISDKVAEEWGTESKKCLSRLPGNWGADLFIYYKPWAPLAINLREYMNNKIRIRIYNQDCLPTGHFSYMYLAGECRPLNITAYACAAEGSDTTGYLEAPEYLSDYQWYAGVHPNGRPVPDIKGGKNRRLYITEDDFEGAGSSDLTYYCTFKSYLDPNNPCEDFLTASISNTKPKIVCETDPSCDRWVTLTNRSYVPSSNSRLDTTKTYWELEDGTIFRTHSQIKHQFPSAGMNSVTLSVENVDGCVNKVDIPFNVMDELEVDFKTDKPNYCIDDMAVFTVTSPESYSYTWYSRSFTLIGHEIYPTLTFRDTIVTLEARMGDCINKITKKIDIEPYPQLTVAGDTAICYGQSTTLTVSADTTVVNYDWSYSPSGNPVIFSGETYTVKPDNSTNFYIAVTTKNGCRSISGFNVSVLRPAISIDTTRICPGGVVTLTASALDYLVTEYSWRSDPESVLTPSGTKNNTLIVDPRVTTDYYLTANSTLGCIPLEATERVTLFPYPVPEIYINPGFVDVEEPVVRLEDKSAYGVTSFWNLGDGTTSTDRALTYQYSGEALMKDSVTIALTSYNELLCSGSTSITIPIDPLVIQFPNAFSPGQDNNNLFVPSTKSVFNEYQLYIYNRWGELVFQTKNVNEGWDGKFNGKDCPNGAYVWLVNFTRPSKSRVYSMKGTVLLVR